MNLWNKLRRHSSFKHENQVSMRYRNSRRLSNGLSWNISGLDVTDQFTADRLIHSAFESVVSQDDLSLVSRTNDPSLIAKRTSFKQKRRSAQVVSHNDMVHSTPFDGRLHQEELQGNLHETASLHDESENETLSPAVHKNKKQSPTHANERSTQQPPDLGRLTFIQTEQQSQENSQQNKGKVRQQQSEESSHLEQQRLTRQQMYWQSLKKVNVLLSSKNTQSTDYMSQQHRAKPNYTETTNTHTQQIPQQHFSSIQDGVNLPVQQEHQPPTDIQEKQNCQKDHQGIAKRGTENKNGPPRPLTAPVRRPDPDQRSRTSSADSERSQDDSAVYSKTKTKTRSRRRVESFNLKSSTSKSSVTSVRDEARSESDSLNSSQASSSQALHKMLPSTKSTPSLHYLSRQDGAANQTLLPVPSWQSSDVSRSHNNLNQSEVESYQSQLKKTLSYSSTRDTAWGSVDQKGLALSEANREHNPQRGLSLDELNQGYNSGASCGPGLAYSQQYNAKAQPWASVSKSMTQMNSSASSDLVPPSVHSQSSYSVSSNHRRQYSQPVQTESYVQNLGATTPRSYTSADELRQTAGIPKDVSSPRYTQAASVDAYSHEKFPSWPVTSAPIEPSMLGVAVSNSTGRTYSSWAGSSPHQQTDVPGNNRLSYPSTNRPQNDDYSKHYADESSRRYQSDTSKHETPGNLRQVVEQTPPEHLSSVRQNTTSSDNHTVGSYQNINSPRMFTETDIDSQVTPRTNTSSSSYLVDGTNSADPTSRLPASGLNFMAKNKLYYRMDTEASSQRVVPKDTQPIDNQTAWSGSATNEDNALAGQVPVSKQDIVSANHLPTRERKHYKIDTIKENEEDSSPHTPRYSGGHDKKELSSKAREDLLDKINEHPESQTSMLRKLSNEMYSAQGRYGLGMTTRLSSSDKEEESIKFEGASSKLPSQERKFHNQPKESSSSFDDKDVFIPQTKTEEEDSKDQSHQFRRNRLQQSRRKAYGICDDADDSLGKKSSLIPQHGRTASASGIQASAPPSAHKSQSSFDALFARKKKDKKEKKTKTKSRSPQPHASDSSPPTTMDKSLSSGQLPLQSDESDDVFKLRRTSSDQLRPKNKKIKEQEIEKHKISDPELSRGKRHKATEQSPNNPSAYLSQPGSFPLASSAHHSLSNSHSPSSSISYQSHPVSQLSSAAKVKSQRSASDSDGVFGNSSDGVSHARLSGGIRSASTGAPPEERLASDQSNSAKNKQNALVDLVQRKTGKRMSTSSMDSGMGSVLSGTQSSLSGTQGTSSEGNSERTHVKAPSPWLDEYWKTRGQNAKTGATPKSASLPRDTPPTLSQYPSPASESSPACHVNDRTLSSNSTDISPPQLLVMTQTTPRTGAPNFSPSGGEYSPPPHPWNSTKNQSPPILSRIENLHVLVDEGGTDELHDSSFTHPKTYQYSDSSGGPNSPTSTLRPSGDLNLNPSSFSVTANQNYVDDDDKPPTLPPRNYRRQPEANVPAKTRKPVPNPSTHITPVKSEVRYSPTEVDKAATTPKSGPSENLISDFDTPKEDYYADQLRQQLKKIGLRPSNKPLLESKSSLPPTRAVESAPRSLEGAAPPVPSHITSSCDHFPSTSPEPKLPSSVSTDTSAAASQPIYRSKVVAEDLNHLGVDAEKQSDTDITSPLAGGPKSSIFPRSLASNFISSPNVSSSPQQTVVSDVTSFSHVTLSQSRLRSHPEQGATPPLPKTGPPELETSIAAPYLEAPRTSLKEIPTESNANDTPRDPANRPFKSDYRRRSGSRDTDATSPMATTSSGQEMVASRLNLDPSTCVDPPSQETIVRATPPAKVTVITSSNATNKKVSPLTDSSKPPPWRAQHTNSASPADNIQDHQHYNSQFGPDVHGNTVSPHLTAGRVVTPESEKHHCTVTKASGLDNMKESPSNMSSDSLNSSMDTPLAPEPVPRPRVRSAPHPKTKPVKNQLCASMEALLDDKSAIPTPQIIATADSDILSETPQFNTKGSPSPVTNVQTEKKKKRLSAEKGNKEGKNKRSPKSKPPVASPKDISKSPSPPKEVNTSKELPEAPNTTSQTSEPSTSSVTHMKQKSQEEIAYEQQAKIVASQIRDKDRRLSEVILPPAEHKKTTDFIQGLFDTNCPVMRRPSVVVTRKNADVINSENNNADNNKQSQQMPVSSSSSYWSPPSINSLHGNIQTECINNQNLLTSDPDVPLECQKEELVGRLEKKLDILREEKSCLEEEITENKKLGQQVAKVVEQKCQSKQEINKYRLYVDEMEQVTFLLLKLSGRLAKAENAVIALPENASASEKLMVTRKRDELHEKHEDAKDLKEGIDKRSQQVSAFLKKYLTEDEFLDYDYFIKTKSQLTIDHQDIEDRMKEGEEQLKALKQSMQC